MAWNEEIVIKWESEVKPKNIFFTLECVYESIENFVNTGKVNIFGFLRRTKERKKGKEKGRKKDL